MSLEQTMKWANEKINEQAVENGKLQQRIAELEQSLSKRIAGECFCPHSWPEDYPHENGKYLGKCVHCDADFLGHKRRPSCKKCHLDHLEKRQAELEAKCKSLEFEEKRAFWEAFETSKLEPDNHNIQASWEKYKQFKKDATARLNQQPANRRQ